MSVSPERRAHHSGATGKTLITPYAVGTHTHMGVITQVRSKKKYARRYLVRVRGPYSSWFRHDELRLAGDES
jgi:hypothetical protein